MHSPKSRMLSSRSRLALPHRPCRSRIFIPDDLFPWQTHPDQVDPAVLVDIHAKIKEGVAELCQRIIMLRRVDRMSCPIWRFEPPRAGDDIRLSVVIDIRDRDTFRDKISRDNMFDESLLSLSPHPKSHRYQ